MIVFEDQDGEYEVEQLKKRNLAVRIRTILFFAVFIIFIFSLAKNGFSFDFTSVGDSGDFKVLCEGIEYKSTDDSELMLTKAMEVLEKNKEKIQILKGYVKSSASLESAGYKGRQIPVIKVTLNQVDSNKLPDSLCGYQLKVIYK